MEFTVKQEQILSLAARGLKDQSIAETMGISVRTVQNHFARIYTKTHTNRVGSIILYVSTKVQVVKRGKQGRKKPSLKKKIKEIAL